jgi:hypothetical protein
MTSQAKSYKRHRGPKRGESHVRLYAHELACPAYRQLSTDARALLIEMRSFYSGGKNVVFLSIRQMQILLGCAQRRAQNARDELLAYGWIRVIEKGAYSRKSALATTYALTNEPIENRDGAIAPKDYMRWQRPAEKNAVADLNAISSQNSYANIDKTNCKEANSSRHDYCKSAIRKITVAETTTQIDLPREHSERDVLIWAAMTSELPDKPQEWLLAAWLLLNYEPLMAAA